MTKALVVFSRNKDRKTANMIIDNYLINEAIPFIPRLAIDHRGLTLFYYCKENGLDWSELEFDEFTEQLSEIKRGYDYLNGPIQKEVLFSIEERLSQPFEYWGGR